MDEQKTTNKDEEPFPVFISTSELMLLIWNKVPSEVLNLWQAGKTPIFNQENLVWQQVSKFYHPEP